ncbi:MAG: type II toxin-antitoxin system prevent-host-death family antitoxin [Thiocapsa sp.]|nr:type II toxin-antitoxin system prevent-host-death family antitoxin [Thiocapsa sp.]
MHDAKTQLSRLIALAEAGQDVGIARANKPVVRLVPIAPPAKRRRLGEARGLVTMGPTSMSFRTIIHKTL